MKQKTIFILTTALTCLSMSGVARAANDRYYVATMQPNDVAPNSTTNFNLNVTNNILSGPSHFLRQVIVTVPSGFTITGPVTVQAPAAAPLPWKVTVSGQTITVISGSTSDASVTAGQGITITVPAKAPALSGACPKTDSYTWGISASQVVGGGTGNAYLLTPGTTNPVVKVSCDTFTNLGLTISPDSIGSTNTSALLTLTAHLTTSAGVAVNGETIAFTVGGQPVTCQSPAVTTNGYATCSYYPLPNPLLVTGTYDCQATFAGDSALGLGSNVSQTVKLNINATGTGLSVAPASGPYNGTTNLSATLTANGSPLAGKTVSFALGSTSVGSSVTDANGVASLANVSIVGLGPGTIENEIKASFAGDGTYSAANGDATLTVGLIQPVITWNNPADITYGTPLGATQLNATAAYQGAAIAGTFAYSPAAGTVLSAGSSQTLSVTFTPNDLITYSSSSATVYINVLKATPVIAWSNPADIVYGTALSATQLNASVTPSIAGSFVYTPASGTVLGAGSGQTLSVTFTPSDSVDFNGPIGATVKINVLKATPVVTWNNPADITYGTALSATQLNATASAPGTFVYNPATGTVLNAGNGQTLSVQFTPTDTADYNTPAAKSVLINVLKATPVITWNNPAPITYGTALSGTQLNATASVAGSFVYTPATGTVLNAGNGQTLSVQFTPTDTTNYSSPVTKTVTITVLRATPLISWSNPADIPYGTALGTTQLNATSTVPGVLTYNPAAGTVLDPGTSQALNVSFVPTDSVDYTNASATVYINVTQASQTITFTTMTVTATASSDGLVTFTSGSPEVCTVDQVKDASNNPVVPGQAKVTLVPGQTNWALCKVAANQSGNSSYAPAPQATAILGTPQP